MNPFPLDEDTKWPPPEGITGYDGCDPTDRDYKRWERDGAWGNLGLVVPDGIIGADLDLHKHWAACPECNAARDGLSPRKAREMVLDRHGYGPLPPTVHTTSRADGSGIYLYRVPPGTKLVGKFSLGETVQWFHRYALAWPSVHPDTGQTYRWWDDDDNELDILTEDIFSDLPMLPEDDLAKLAAGDGDMYADADEWMASLPNGQMDGSVRTCLNTSLAELAEGGGRHTAMLKATSQLVQLGADRHPGVYEAISTYIEEFTAQVDGERGRDATAEVDRAISGAIRKYGKPFDWYEEKRAKLRSPEQREDDFWHSHAQLAYIFEVARQQMVAPWAALGAVLARVVAGSDWRIALPNIICSKTSLNLFVVITGTSGEGKGGAMGLAEELVPWDIYTCGAGTGEGLCAAFVHRQSARQGGNIIYDRSNALIELAEISSLAAVADRKGASILPELCKAWMGEKLGFNNRQRDANLPVEKRSYRMGLVAAAQPRKAGVLLNELDGGLTQRCLFLPGDDPDVDPDEPKTPYEPPDVEPLDLIKPETPGTYGPGTVWTAASQVVKVWPEAAWQVRQARRDRQHGVMSRAVDGHRLLLKEKVAWALGQITGGSPDEIREEDWCRAEVVMQAHDATYDMLLDAQRRAGREANTMRAKNEAEREVIKSDVIHEQAVRRVAASIMRKLAGEPLHRNPTRKALASRDRDYFDDAVSLLVKSEQVETDDEGRLCGAK